MIGKVLFLIENRHFLIRKWHFGKCQGSYVEPLSGRQQTHPYQELQMIRRRLFLAATVIASVVLAACSDMTAPKNDVCPVTGGSQTCVGH
jgi:hypothetical protein